MSDLPDFMLAPGAGRVDAASIVRVVSEEAPAGEPPPTPKREPRPFEAGVFEDMPAEHYFAVEAMSQSGAKEMLKSPMHYRFSKDNPTAPTPAMQFGTAVHTGILEPEKFDAAVVAIPACDRRTKDGKATFAAFMATAVGKIALPQADFDRCRRTIDAVHRHPMARELLAGAEVETSLFWIDNRYKVPCKARVDARNHGGLIDVKTTQNASPHEWPRTVASWGYEIQAAAYFDGCEHLLDATPAFFVHIAVESEAPHGVACYALQGDAIGVGRARWNLALERYAKAQESGFWPAYSDRIEAIRLPRWATRLDP